MTRDLIVLVPDKDIEQAVRGILARWKALGIRLVRFELLVHPNRDPGCYHTGHEILRPYVRDAAHALIIFDRAWDGAPSESAEDLASDVEEKLYALWADRARCVVVNPEIEAWAWSDSPHVATSLGWKGTTVELRRWLKGQGLWPAEAVKPPDPKRAFEVAVRHAGLPPSSSIFTRLARMVSLERCTDAAFQRLRATLRGWFPSDG